MKKDTLCFFRNLLLCSTVISFTGSCNDDDLAPIDVHIYPRPAIGEVVFFDTHKALLNGHLLLHTKPIDDHGFIYARSEITSAASGTKVSLGVTETSGPLSFLVDNLEKNTIYFARVYVHLDDTTLLSDQISFTTANTNEWIRVSDGFSGSYDEIFALDFRSRCNFMELGGKAYLPGYGGSRNGELIVPLYEYDPKTDQLTRMPDFPGSYRSSPVRFVAEDKIYMGMGQPDLPLGIPPDFYSFSPDTRIWTRVKDFGGTPMAAAATVSFGDIAYVGFGLGDKGFEEAFWQYNARTDTWTEKTSPLPGGLFLSKVLMSVSIGNKAYFLFDRSGFLEVWEYTPLSDEWVRKQDYPGTIVRLNNGSAHPLMSMTAKGKGYVFDQADNILVYDPALDGWSSLPACPNKDSDRFAVSIEDRLYVGSTDNVYMYIPE